ncbi:methyltransferase domain-containing protein [Franzmannia qiaohouensis]|uniref:tRNA (guanine(46)-N(7))-methyltransferase n=1 Tax=Franzmannia qiaohouensis TaxID=1329370 RepID=A0ABU1HDD8_9GAMM|nr:methyltransferase domain-containing protein [Halomonas qiaohouensis]MDR5905366.1 SAM-dependent methyltransferase [Halomonas qiaohouensis]
MSDESRRIQSRQSGPHDDLQRRVQRALEHPWRKPIADHTRGAFDAAAAWLAEQRKPLVLDAGCGVGLSTRRLAERHPGHAVLGIDRSADRLSRDHGPLPANARLVRADLVDFWRLALAAGWRPEYHYLLYPNPYPKSVHLKLRWQGHPVLPHLLALGGQLELRSNWAIYVEEFGQALHQSTGVTATIAAFDPGGEPLTPFERKYHASGQTLWRLVASLAWRPDLVPRDMPGVER